MAVKIRNINWELPSSIIEIIFSKLPFYNFPCCRIVCKEWNDLISNCKFDSQISNSNLFLSHYGRKIHCVDLDPKHLNPISTVASYNFLRRLSYGDFTIANSCNGLLLLIKEFCRKGRTMVQVVFVLNLMTNEYLEILKSKQPKYNSDEYYYGLGFSPRTKQYKVARMCKIRAFTFIEIFALGRNCEYWTTLYALPHLFQLQGFAYHNGGLYFVENGVNRVIYRLDVEREKLSKISFPKDPREGFYSVVDLNDTLYLTIYGNDHLLQLWKMREDFVWIHVFALCSQDKLGTQFFRVIKVYDDEKILYIDGFDLVVYDPKSDTKLIWTDQGIALIKELVMGRRSVFQISSFNFDSLFKIFDQSCILGVFRRWR